MNIETTNIGFKSIPQRSFIFQKFSGAPLQHTFGNKAVIDLDGRPMFAELAIAETFKKEGYSARWVETYGRGKKLPKFLTKWEDRPYKDQKEEPIAERCLA